MGDSTFRRAGFALVLLFAAAWSALPADAAPDCSRVAGPTEVRIERIAAPVAYNLDETSAEIGARSGLASGHGAVVRGLTESAFHSKLSVTFASMTTPAGVCVPPHSVELHSGFDPVIVYIERDYARGSCQFEAIDRHERGHVGNMNVALEAALPKIRAALAGAVKDSRYPLFAADEDIAQRDAVAIIDAALSVPLDAFTRERAAMDGALDSPESYGTLKASCATW
jgi:hypothetical protein